MSNQIETYIEVKLENRDQVSVLFRYILIVPVLIFAAAFAPGGAETFSFGIGMIVVPVLLAIVFRGYIQVMRFALTRRFWNFQLGLPLMRSCSMTTIHL